MPSIILQPCSCLLCGIMLGTCKGTWWRSPLRRGCAPPSRERRRPSDQNATYTMDPGTLGISCAHRAGPQPLGQLLWEPPQGRRMRRRWIDPAAQGLALSSPPPRARCSRSAAAALRQFAALRQYAAAAPLLLDSHRVLDGPLRGRGQHRAGSLLRAGADRGCDSRLRRRICGLAHARLRVHKYPGRSRATAPGAGWDISS